jgi:hypothetical protein
MESLTNSFSNCRSSTLSDHCTKRQDNFVRVLRRVRVEVAISAGSAPLHVLGRLGRSGPRLGAENSLTVNGWPERRSGVPVVRALDHQGYIRGSLVAAVAAVARCGSTSRNNDRDCGYSSDAGGQARRTPTDTMRPRRRGILFKGPSRGTGAGPGCTGPWDSRSARRSKTPTFVTYDGRSHPSLAHRPSWCVRRARWHVLPPRCCLGDGSWWGGAAASSGAPSSTPGVEGSKSPAKVTCCGHGGKY